MLASSQESTLVHHFGVFSLQTLPAGHPVQHTLHNTQTTTFCFTAVVDKIQIDVQVIFTPFQRPSRRFTYHDYEVQCLNLPERDSRQAQNAILTITQLLYDRNFLENAGYRFRFSEQDVQLPEARTRKRKRSEQLKLTNEGAPGLVWMPQHPCFAAKDKLSSNRPKPTFKATIEDIRGAYEDAHNQGRLQSLSVPQLQQKGSSAANWDPYAIPSNKLEAALLNDEKLKTMHSQLKKVTQRVPSAAEWNEKTQAKNLTPADLRTILRIALGSTPDQPQLLLGSDTSPIIALGLTFLRYADCLDSQTRTVTRGVLVARLIGFSVMRVYEAITHEDNEKVNEQMQKHYSCTQSWQNRSRILACHWNWMMARLPGWKGREVSLYLLLTENSGEQILRDLFKRSLPAAVGELTTILNDKKYSIVQPDAMGMPSILEIVKCLLSGHADDVALCQAFGCPDTYLDGSTTDWLEKFRLSHESVMAIEVVKGSLAPSDSTQADVWDDIYGGQGILQNLDHYPYAFNLTTAHDLDSLERSFLLYQ